MPSKFTEAYLNKIVYSGSKPYMLVLKEHQDYAVTTKEIEINKLSFILKVYSWMKEASPERIKKLMHTYAGGLAIPELEELARVYAKRVRSAKDTYATYYNSKTNYEIEAKLYKTQYDLATEAKEYGKARGRRK